MTRSDAPVVLSCYLSPRDHYRPIMFSANDVFCGPDATPEQLPDGRVRALRTAPGPYDIGQVVASLPAARRPELVVVKADATMRNLPRNLAALRCPKVLVVGDTQHLDDPIRRILDYAQAERFDFILSDHNRQHLHFFRKAGFRNVHWIPCLTWRPLYRDVPETAPAGEVVFVGQVGRFHPHRTWLLEELRRRGVPLAVKQLPQEKTADAYAAAPAALNCSLNGDLNLRVFEILGAGGLLVTDALSRESGLARILGDGEHMLTYRSVDDLAETLRHRLAEPESTLAIRRAGRRIVAAELGPDALIDAFYDLIEHGRERPDFALDDEPRCAVALPRAELVSRCAAYQAVQEAQRTAAGVRVFASDGPEARHLAEDCADLTRTTFLPFDDMAAPAAGGLAEAHILALRPDDALTQVEQLLPRFHGALVLAIGEGWTIDAYGRLTDLLQRWGFRVDAPDQPVYRRVDGLANAQATTDAGALEAARAKLRALLADPRDNWLAVARLASALKLADVELEALRQAVRHDRDDFTALLALGTRPTAPPLEAFLALDHAGRLRPLGAEHTARRDALLAELGDAPAVAKYLARVRPEPRRLAARPMRVLVVTNLFPPQEMGGYGRKLWEFSKVLRARGHELRIVTADADYLDQPCDAAERALEPLTRRTLELYGSWRDGKTTTIDDRDEAMRRVRHNEAVIFGEIEDFRPDVMLLGNLDFMGWGFIAEALRRAIPMVHCIGNAQPSYPAEHRPRDPLFAYAPCSRWLGEHLRAAGYAIDYTVVHPGARVGYFDRGVLPALDVPRIAFGGLVMPYKGAHTLVDALLRLHRAGLEFQCVVAGDTIDPNFVAQLKDHVAQAGCGRKIHFPGFLDRQGLARLFARSNILVFPSQFEEPFGITQVEAMAAGLAVVTSATGGAGEIVRHEVDGLHFRRGDAGDLAATLHRLVRDPGLWRRLCVAGHARAAEFAVERSVDVLEGLFERLAAQAAS